MKVRALRLTSSVNSLKVTEDLSRWHEQQIHQFKRLPEPKHLIFWGEFG